MSDEKPQKQGMALKWRLLIWGGVLTLLLVIAGVAGGGYLVWKRGGQRLGVPQPVTAPASSATAVVDEHTIPPASRDTASLPLDPWSVPAVPVDHVLGIFPFGDKEGEITNRTDDIQSALQNSYRLRMPRSGAITAALYVNGTLERISPYGLQKKRHPTSEHEAALFFNCTHTIAGTFTEEDGVLTVDVLLRQYRPDRSTTDHTTRITVPAGHDYILAAQIYTWAHQVGSIPWDAATAAAMGSPLMGASMPGATVEPLLSMNKDPRDPRWKSAPPAGRFFHAVAAEAAGASDMAGEFDTGPLPVTAGYAERMVRFVAHAMRKDVANQAHELELLLSIYPGLHYTVEHWRNLAGARKYRPERHVKALTEWQKRLPDSSYPLSVLGSSALEAAWNWRGNGYANTVTAEGWKNYHPYMDMAEKHLEASLKTDGLDPYYAARLVALYGSDGRRTDMHRIHRLTAERYPDQVDTWLMVTHYLRPRWGGTVEEAAALIDQAMRSRPDNLAMGRLGVAFWGEEASLVGYEKKQTFFLAPYMNENAVAKRQVKEGLIRISDPRSSYADRKLALIAYVVQDDKTAIHALLRSDPTLSRDVDNVMSQSYARLPNRAMASALWHLGEFDEMVYLADTVTRWDGEPGTRETNLVDGYSAHFVGYLRDFGFVLHGIAAHQRGDLALAERYLGQAANSPLEGGKVFAYRYTQGLLKEDPRAAVRRLRELGNQDAAVRYCEVLMHYRSGRMTEAAVLWKTLRAGSDYVPDWLAELIAKETGYTL